jgi:hypothetical protein
MKKIGSMEEVKKDLENIDRQMAKEAKELELLTKITLEVNTLKEIHGIAAEEQKEDKETLADLTKSMQENETILRENLKSLQARAQQLKRV